MIAKANTHPVIVTIFYCVVKTVCAVVNGGKCETSELRPSNFRQNI